MKRAAVIAGGALAAIGLTGVAVAASGEDAPQSSAQSVDANLREHLSLFRDANGPAVVPSAIREVIDSSIGTTRAGADWRLAQAVNTPAGTVYVIPGDGTICQLGGGGIGCGDASSLGDDPRDFSLTGFSTATNPEGTATVSGIVADNVRQIDAVQPDGSKIDVPVTDNVYGSFIPDDTAKLVFTTSTGETFVSDGPDIPTAPSLEDGKSGTLTDQGR